MKEIVCRADCIGDSGHFTLTSHIAGFGPHNPKPWSYFFRRGRSHCLQPIFLIFPREAPRQPRTDIQLGDSLLRESSDLTSV